MRRFITILIGLLPISTQYLNAQAHSNDNIWYNNGAEVSVQPGCLVTVQGDMTNNGQPDPSVNHLTNDGFVWVQGNLYGDDQLQQRGNGTLRLMNSTTVTTPPYPGEYQVISGGYRVRGCQSSIGVNDGSFFKLELANSNGLVFIKTNDADVRGSVDFNPPATTQDNNSIDASLATNRILTYDPGTGSTPAAAPANGASYTTVFGMMNNAPGLANYLNNTITSNGNTSSVDNAYIQGKHRRAIAPSGGAYGYPMGLEPSTAQGRGVQYSLFTYASNTYDCVTGYFQEGSDNTGTATSVCTPSKTPNCWGGPVHGEWIYSSNASGGGTGAYNLEIFPQHFGCVGKETYVMTRNDQVPNQVSATDNCEANPVTLDQNWPQGISNNTQFGFVGAGIFLSVRLVSFTARTQDSKVALNWLTRNETNMASHTIERSTNGYIWSAIGTVAARNLSSDSYTIYDNSPAICNNFYRLKSTDFEGRVSYSNVLMVQYNCKKSSTITYPNPAKDIVNVSLQNVATFVNARLVKANGQEVWKGRMQAGTNSIDVSEIPSGLYILHLIDANNNIETHKIIIQH